MRPFNECIRVVRWLFGRRAVEARLAEEMRFHVERQIEAYVRAGVSPNEARRRALLEFGGVEAAKEMDARRVQAGLRRGDRARGSTGRGVPAAGRSLGNVR